MSNVIMLSISLLIVAGCAYMVYRKNSKPTKQTKKLLKIIHDGKCRDHSTTSGIAEISFTQGENTIWVSWYKDGPGDGTRRGVRFNGRPIGEEIGFGQISWVYGTAQHAYKNRFSSLKFN